MGELPLEREFFDVVGQTKRRHSDILREISFFLLVSTAPSTDLPNCRTNRPLFISAHTRTTAPPALARATILLPSRSQWLPTPLTRQPPPPTSSPMPRRTPPTLRPPSPLARTSSACPSGAAWGGGAASATEEAAAAGGGGGDGSAAPLGPTPAGHGGGRHINR